MFKKIYNKYTIGHAIAPIILVHYLIIPRKVLYIMIRY